MSGGIPSLALKDEDVTKFLASSTHIGATNLDFQMGTYVFKRRSDGESSQKSKKQAVDCRRSTAAQFFVEENVEETVTADSVVQLLNDALEPKEENGALKNLSKVKDYILYKEPRLLDSFLDEVVSFQHDKNVKVRQFVVQFIEDVCKQEPKSLPKLVGNLDLMLQDPSINIQKKVLQTTTQLYTVAIKWLCNAKNIDELMIATWASICVLKAKLFLLLDSDNEGLRTLAVKFMEIVILTQTPKDQYYDLKKGELSLDDIPVILKIFRPRKMEEEAKEVFQKIVDFHNASHVSGSNLMACMQVLTTIARKRFQFYSKVLLAFESLHANMPPTLSQSQVSSVRKNLKLQLFILGKHPASSEFQSRMSILLSDLGATPLQISKCFPSLEKQTFLKSGGSAAKKSDRTQISRIGGPSKVAPKIDNPHATAADITAADLITKFSCVNAADLVLVSMLSLPDVMPVHFQSTYTPIAAAGTDPQIQHLARLLATQMTAARIGKGIEIKATTDEKFNFSDDEDDDSAAKQIKTVVNLTTDHLPKKQGLVLLPSGSAQPKMFKASKKIDFHINVKPLSKEESNRFSRSAFSRILNAEKAVAKKGASAIRTKILATLATQLSNNVASDLRYHILENPRTRIELGFSWLYQEYAACKGFEGSLGRSIEHYEEAVNWLLQGVLSDELNSVMFSRFFLDLPCVTESMANTLKDMSSVDKAAEQVFEVAKSMCLRRPPQKLLFLGVISDLTLHENEEVRSRAVDAAFEIYEDGRMKTFIEAFALRSLKFLLNPAPEAVNFPFFNQLPEVWSDDLIKVCLNLYFALLPVNHCLIRDLGMVYVETTADVKRTILRALEVPVKQISMTSPELLHFVKNCPQGAETFVTRIIHILTDKATPSVELVAHVRDLYHKRVPDVRFLIPIINGLTKREVIAALPELVKLNPTVVKEVFHRLVGSNLVSPLTPAELLVALHNIDTKQCSLKTVIKATSLCFEEKHIYTQVVLAMVMQQLMEQNPLPILLMRTVIQSLAHHPHLLGFVTNILQRLIIKEVWKQPKIWEGFIRCCQRTKPQSFQVLLQLPPSRLEEVLKSYPDLRDPLCQHVDAFTEHQKAHISADIIKVLEAVRPEDPSANMVDALSDLGDTSEPLPPGEENA